MTGIPCSYYIFSYKSCTPSVLTISECRESDSEYLQVIRICCFLRFLYLYLYLTMSLILWFLIPIAWYSSILVGSSLTLTCVYQLKVYFSVCLISFLGQGNANMACSQPENGFISSFSLFPEKAVQELLQSPVQGSDDHLIEFSEALRSMIIFCWNY